MTNITAERNIDKMREIKFRAWDKINKVMVKIARLDIVDGMAYTHLFNSSPLDFWNDAILEQFTGLHDKNGVEIYEGDKVKIVYDGEEYVYQVVFDISELDFKATNGEENYRNNFQYLPCCEEIEVIGNIHERSEDNEYYM